MKLSLLEEVRAERDRQDGKWGGPDHDAEQSFTTWCHLIRAYADWAWVMLNMGGQGRAKGRRRLIQTAALALAAVEAMDAEDEE